MTIKWGDSILGLLLILSAALLVFAVGVESGRDITEERIERQCLLKGEYEINGTLFSCERKPGANDASTNP